MCGGVRERLWLLLQISPHMHTSRDLLLCVVHRGVLFDPQWDAWTETCLQLFYPDSSH